jgi:RNA polymerase sigma-70 factor (ECF subfamily)
MAAEDSSRARDDDLVLRVADGDARAFEAIYHRYRAPALALAIRVTGSRSSAEEATQDAFVALWRTARRYDPSRGTLKAWLLAMVRNRSIDSLRRGARHNHHVGIDAALVERVEAAERTEDLVAAREEARNARRLVAGLPSAQRQVIELAFFSGLTQTEVAATVGIPLGTVKGRQRLGLAKLHASSQSAGCFGR